MNKSIQGLDHSKTTVDPSHKGVQVISTQNKGRGNLPTRKRQIPQLLPPPSKNDISVKLKRKHIKTAYKETSETEFTLEISKTKYLFPQPQNMKPLTERIKSGLVILKDILQTIYLFLKSLA